MNRIAALRAIAQNIGDLLVDSTVASTTASQIYNGQFVFTREGQLIGKHLYIDTGAAAGQSRLIGSLHPANGYVIVAQAFSSVPSVNSTFFITEKANKAEYDNAIDRAFGIARTRYLEDRVATLQLVATQYEYPVPSGMEWISTLRLVPSGNTDYNAASKVDTIFEIPPRYFRNEINAVGSYVIVLDSRQINLDDFDEEWVNVIGQAKPSPIGSDNSIVPAELEEYLIAAASMNMASRRMGENQEWVRKFYMFRDEVKGRGLSEPGLEDYIFRHGRGRRVK